MAQFPVFIEKKVGSEVNMLVILILSLKQWRDTVNTAELHALIIHEQM